MMLLKLAAYGHGPINHRGSRLMMLVTSLAIALATTVAWAQSTARDAMTPPTAVTDNTAELQGNSRIREGTEMVNQNGHFRLTGDRVTFFTNGGKGRFVVLENLNLERVSRILAENPDHLQWNITATVTEYRGANYIFVRKAVRRDESEEDNRFGS
jgi:hypothetical protein